MATIVHFEIPADNVERANKFYGSLFGWKAEKVQGMEYLGFRTGDDAIGGIMKRQMPDQQITNYFGIDSVDKHAKKIQELGGKVKVPKTDVPGFGWFAICTDTENNTFAVWENSQQR